MVGLGLATLGLAGAAAIGALTLSNNEAALWIAAAVLAMLSIPLLVSGWWRNRKKSPPALDAELTGIYIGGGRVQVGGRGNVVSGNTFTTVYDAQPPNITAIEYQRQQATLRRLYALYLNSRDDVTPEMASSLEPLPKEWVDEQLAKRGETWRREEYRI